MASAKAIEAIIFVFSSLPAKKGRFFETNESHSNPLPFQGAQRLPRLSKAGERDSAKLDRIAPADRSGVR